MTVPSLTIKKTARESLKNNWVKAIIVSSATLFCFLINYCISSSLYPVLGDAIANLLFYIMNFFMFSPVFMGAVRFFWHLLCGVSDEPISVFYYFNSKQNYVKILKLSFRLVIKTLIYALILLIPYFIVSLISDVKIYEFLDITTPLWTANLSNSNIGTFFQSLAIIGTLFLMLKYYLAPMLIVSDENMEVSEAIHMSVVISKRTTLDFIALIFSMLGWILLSLVFVPLIFTIPLFIAVYLVHSSFAVSDYNEHIKKANSDNFPTFVA